MTEQFPRPIDIVSEEGILMFLENQANLRSLENDFSGVLFGFVNKIKEYWEENDTPEQRRDK